MPARRTAKPEGTPEDNNQPQLPKAEPTATPQTRAAGGGKLAKSEEGGRMARPVENEEIKQAANAEAVDTGGNLEASAGAIADAMWNNSRMAFMQQYQQGAKQFTQLVEEANAHTVGFMEQIASSVRNNRTEG